MRTLQLAAVLALSTACVPTSVVPDSERARSHAALDGQARYLRVATSLHPFFGDKKKCLLLDAPLGEVDLIRGAREEVVPPPPAERILPPGTPVRIQEIEFPTDTWAYGWLGDSFNGALIARRVVMTPRYHPWVMVSLAGEPRPCVVVLSQTVATAEVALAEVGRMLTTDDPTPVLKALPREQKDAVLRQELVEGMTTTAVEMAWGVPERRHIDRPDATEAWSWPGGKRRAYFHDDKLSRWER
jgi:hypothetical protein